MGQFSWCFADKQNKENLLIGNRAVVCCPDGSFIYENQYDGFGHFGGSDIYDLVVDWNRDYLWCYINATSTSWSKEDIIISIAAMVSDEKAQAVADMLYKDAEFNQWKRKKWKRLLGIRLACYDEDNSKIKYPIKITTKKCNYNTVPASKSDPNQGWELLTDEQVADL